MTVTAKFIRMRRAQRKVMRPWVAEKQAQLKNTSCRGCAWYTGQRCCYRGYPSWLQKGLCANWRVVADLFWRIETTIWRIFFAKEENRVDRLSSHQRNVVKYYAIITESSTKLGILSRMLFYILSAGEKLLVGMQKDAPLFSPPFKSDVYLYGKAVWRQHLVMTKLFIFW